MLKFELTRLTTYTDEALLAEVRRVGLLVPSGPLSSTAFRALSKVHPSTLRKRFGNWRLALAAAGIESRFDDKSEAWSRQELIDALKALAAEQGTGSVTKEALKARLGVWDRPIRRLFGSYRAALEAAGLSQSPGGLRHTDDECFENLLTVWMAKGRQPFFDEMKRAPSRVGPKAYANRWGGWRAALAAFVERVNSEEPAAPAAEPAATGPTSPERKRSPRGVSLRLRYLDLMRDRLRCVLCGRSPATHPHISLEVDHIIAWSDGGETVESNLRLLCNECNQGKGDSREVVPAGIGGRPEPESVA